MSRDHLHDYRDFATHYRRFESGPRAHLGSPTFFLIIQGFALGLIFAAAMLPQ